MLSTWTSFSGGLLFAFWARFVVTWIESTWSNSQEICGETCITEKAHMFFCWSLSRQSAPLPHIVQITGRSKWWQDVQTEWKPTSAKGLVICEDHWSDEQGPFLCECWGRVWVESKGAGSIINGFSPHNVWLSLTAQHLLQCMHIVLTIYSPDSNLPNDSIISHWMANVGEAHY